MDTVWIFGGSSGIGLELARIYLATHRVVCFQRRPCPLPEAISLSFDVTADDWQKVEEECATALPRFVFYCAGMSLSAPYPETPEPLSRTLFETNFWGYARLVRILAPRLRQGATLVALSSLASILPIPYDPFYSASKAALNAFNEALAAEFGKLRFLSVLVGGTATNFSFKRWIPERREEKHDFATSALRYVEQHGLSAQALAGGIALLCDRRFPPPRPSVGLSNVLLKGAERLMSTRIKSGLTKLFYYGFPRLLKKTPYAPVRFSGRNRSEEEEDRGKACEN